MDISEKVTSLNKDVENAKSEGDMDSETKDTQFISTNYDLNILCDSFTYLCTTAHLEPLLKSAWWINTNWQNKESALDQQTSDASSSEPSTSRAAINAEHSHIVTPPPKRPQSSVNINKMPIKKRRMTNEQ